MRISVLGTGTVGRTLAGRLAELGHDVVIGTRDPAETLARTEPDRQGTAPYAQWQEQAGDEPSAKQAVTDLLGQLGWGPDRVVDLGGLTAARGLEAFVCCGGP
jgi:predicted dinucleotide-binding enzyme